MKSVLAVSNQEKPLTDIILKAWALVKTLCVILLAQCLGQCTYKLGGGFLFTM